MTTNRTAHGALNTLLTGYLIDGVTNYCGQQIEALSTPIDQPDFFTKIVGMDSGNIEEHLVTHFAKYDQGYRWPWNWNKHKNLAKNLAKYICKTRDALDSKTDIESYTFNPGFSLWPYKSSLYLACEKTNTGLNFFSRQLSSPGNRGNQASIADYLITADNTMRPEANQSQSTDFSAQSLATEISTEILNRLKDRLTTIKSHYQNCWQCKEEFKQVFKLLNDETSKHHAHLKDLTAALKAVENAIRDKYSIFQPLSKDDKNHINDIKEVRLGLLKGGVMWSLSEIAYPEDVRHIGRGKHAQSVGGLALALKELAKYKNQKLEAENTSRNTNQQEPKTVQRSIFSNLLRSNRKDNNKYSAVASSDSNQTSPKPKAKKASIFAAFFPSRRKVNSALAPKYSVTANSESAQTSPKPKTKITSVLATFFAGSRPTKAENPMTVPAIIKKLLSGRR